MSFNVPITKTSIETGMWAIKRNLLKHGASVADIEFAPLEWYVSTGRASTDFLKALFSAKPFMIARKLHEGGSDEEVIARIKRYIGF